MEPTLTRRTSVDHVELSARRALLTLYAKVAHRPVPIHTCTMTFAIRVVRPKPTSGVGMNAEIANHPATSAPGQTMEIASAAKSAGIIDTLNS